MGGRIDDFAVVESNPVDLLRRHRLGRDPEDDEQRDHLRARLRRPAGLHDRRPHDRPLRPAGPLRGHRRAEQPPVLVLGQRRLQDARRRQDLAARRPRRDPPHRARARAPEQPGRRLRGGARAPLGAEQGARPLQDDRRRHAPGRTRSSSTRTPASWTWRWTRRAPTRCTRPRTSAGARPSASTAAAPAAACGRRSTAGRPGRSSRRACPRARSGRIGLAVYLRDPRIVYALVEHAKEGGIYRSEDRGESWTKMSATNPRPSYYSKLRIDPNNDQRVWVLGAPMYTSEDGGKTFKTDVVDKIHGDYHAMWIDPAELRPHARGQRRRHPPELRPRAQLGLREHRPARAALRGGGRQPAPVPRLRRAAGQRQLVGALAHALPAGDLERRVVPGRRRRRLLHRARPDRPRRRLRREPGRQRRSACTARAASAGSSAPSRRQGEKYRFNWNSPILVSPHDPKTIYYGGNRLFGSRDRGDTWTLVSPDLTTSDNAKRDAMPIFGKPAKELLSRNDGVVHFGTITTLAESPLRAGVLWAGTDDGNLQVSRDGGTTWTNVAARVPGVPKGTYVSRVEASRTGEGAAYVSFDGHRSNDFGVYLFFTSDFGQTWKSVSVQPPGGRHAQRRARAPEERRRALRGHRARPVGELGPRRLAGRALRGKNLPTVPGRRPPGPPARGRPRARHARPRRVDPRRRDAARRAARRPAARSCTSSRSAPRPSGGSTTTRATRGTSCSSLRTRPRAHSSPTGSAPSPGRRTRSRSRSRTRRALSCASSRARSRASGSNRTSWDLRREPPVKPEEGAERGVRGPAARAAGAARAATRSRSPRPARRRPRRSSSRTTRGSR